MAALSISSEGGADLFGFVIDEITRHPTQSASWQVAGYPAQTAIRYIKALYLRLAESQFILSLSKDGDDA